MAPFDESGFKSSLAKMQGSSPSTSGGGGFDHAGFQATLARLKGGASPAPQPTATPAHHNPLQQIGDAVGGWLHRQGQESAQTRKRAAAIQDPFAPEKALLRPAAAPAGAVLGFLDRGRQAVQAGLSGHPGQILPALGGSLPHAQSESNRGTIKTALAHGFNPTNEPDDPARDNPVQHFLRPAMNRFGDSAANLAIDTATDPTTYLGGSGLLEQGYKQAAKHALPAALKVGGHLGHAIEGVAQGRSTRLDRYIASQDKNIPAESPNLFRYQATPGNAEVSQRGGTYFSLGSPGEAYGPNGRAGDMLGGHHLVHAISAPNNPLDLRFPEHLKNVKPKDMRPEDAKKLYNQFKGGWDSGAVPALGTARELRPGKPTYNNIVKALDNEDHVAISRYLKALGVGEAEIQKMRDTGSDWILFDRFAAELAKKHGHDAILHTPLHYGGAPDEFFALHPDAHRTPNEAFQMQGSGPKYQAAKLAQSALKSIGSPELAGKVRDRLQDAGHVVSGIYKGSVPAGNLKLNAAQEFGEKGDTIANRMMSAKNFGKSYSNALGNTLVKAREAATHGLSPEDEMDLYQAYHTKQESSLAPHLQSRVKMLKDTLDSLAHLQADRELKAEMKGFGFQVPDYAKPFDTSTRSIMRKDQYHGNYLPTKRDPSFDDSLEGSGFQPEHLDDGADVQNALELRASKKTKQSSTDLTNDTDLNLKRRGEDAMLAPTVEEQRDIIDNRLRSGARAIAARDTGRRATQLFNSAGVSRKLNLGKPSAATSPNLFRYQSTVGDAEVSPRRGGTFFAMDKPTEKYANMGRLGGQHLVKRVNTAKNPLDIRYKGSGRVPDPTKLSPEELAHARRHSFGDYSHLPGAGVAAHVFPQAEQIAGDGSKFLGGVPEAQELSRAFADKDMPTLHKWLKKLGVPQAEIDAEYGHGNFYAAEDRIGVELARKAGHDALIMRPNPHANSIINPDSDEFVALHPSAHSEPRQAGGGIKNIPAKAGSFSKLPSYIKDHFTETYTKPEDRTWQQKLAGGARGVSHANQSAMFFSPIRHMLNIATLGTLADPSIGGALQTAKTFAKIVGAPPERKYAELKDSIDAGLVGVPAESRTTLDTAEGGLAKHLSDMTMKTPIISHAIKGVRKLYTMSGEILWSFDDASKATRFKRLVGQGLHPADAAAQTNAELIDYANKSEFTNMLKYLAPFATYRTKLPGAIARNVIQHPERSLTVNRLSPALAGGYNQAGTTPDGKPQGLHANLPLAEVMRGADDPEGYARSTMGELPKLLGSRASMFDSDQYPHYLTYGQPVDNAGDVGKGLLMQALNNAPGAEAATSAVGLSQFPDKGLQGAISGQLGLSLGRIPISESALRKAMEGEQKKGFHPTRAQEMRYLEKHGGGQ